MRGPAARRAPNHDEEGGYSSGIGSCGEDDAESYCSKLYAEGGTPAWASRAGYFHDERSCVEWYREAEDLGPLLF
jgi:hypothetical protein